MIDSMDIIAKYLPLLIPVAIIQLALQIAALLNILKHRKFRFGNIVIWIIIVLITGFIGPILYFTIGRADE